jgi:hypothetical protein
MYAELTFISLIGAWVLYEVYGTWLQNSIFYIRIAGGIAILGFLYWHATKTPENLTETLEFAQFLMLSSTGKFKETEKRAVSNLMKKKVAADQSWKCGACQETLDESYEVDHKLALYKGGTNDITNLVALCRNCHGKKTMAERLT